MLPEGYNVSLFIIQIILIVALLGIVIWLLRLTKAIRIEKRIGRYTIDAIVEDDMSFFDHVHLYYEKTRNQLTKLLRRSSLMVRYSKHYEKYIDPSRRLREDPMHYVSTKVLTGVLVLFIVILSDVMQYHSITLLQVIYSLLIGFYIPDLYLISMRQYRKRQVENDLLKAIIIMNNAFKSGRSTMQAIEIVAHELDGPIKDEFQKMYIDLTYGLSLETVFQRFSKRVNVEEVKYITTSLIILNRTGGNIVKVFSSIERSFFNRKKLQQELKSLTASSRLIFGVLICMPFLLFLVIYILNPSYFMPLITTPLGWMVLLVIAVLYVSYILIVRHIMKLE